MISNAIRHSHKNSTININISYHTKIDGFVTFSVKNFGVGLSERAKKNLFKSVVQILPVDLLRGKESGMGLAICNDIVSLHKGTMGYSTGVSSEDNDMSTDTGTGTEFFFSILFEICEELISNNE